MSYSFEIFKTFVASTSHVEEQDMELLRRFPELFSCEDHYYGMSIYLGSGDDNEAQMLREISSMEASEGLRMLVLFAISNDCLWLKLDSDGPIYDGFPSYDW